MNILVTGASGFVGRHLLKYLCTELDAHCIGVSRTASEDTNTLQCELTDYNQVVGVIKKTQPTHVFHVAGSYTNDFETDYSCNVLSTKNILDAAVKHKQDARVMLMGSAAEYGEVNTQECPVSEQHILNPISIYGWSKAAQSHFAPLYSRQHGLAVMVARTFNLMGVGISDKLFPGQLEHQIQQVLSGKTSRITVGKLDAKRDYIDIKDACALYLAIATKGLAGEVYNVGSGCATSMRELLNAMLTANGLDQAIIDEAQHNKSSNEVSVIYADISKVTALMTSSSPG